MSRRMVLLGTTATATAAAAWTVTASAAFLWFAEGTWQIWEPGPFWNSPYFAHGLRWTWAWVSYAARASTRATYGTTLTYTGLAAAAVVGIFAFRVGQLLGYSAGSPGPTVYGKTEWSNRTQMKKGGISSNRRPF